MVNRDILSRSPASSEVQLKSLGLEGQALLQIVLQVPQLLWLSRRFLSGNPLKCISKASQAAGMLRQLLDNFPNLHLKINFPDLYFRLNAQRPSESPLSSGI